MTNNEVNKVIAKFMGGPYTGDGCIGLDCADRPYDHCKKGYVCFYCQPIETHYTNSLDALVPVWIKMSVEDGSGIWINFARHGVEDYHFAFFRHDSAEYDHADCIDSMPQEVAAHATAKAILALGFK